MFSALFHNYQKHNNINETKQHHVIKKRFRFEKISNKKANISTITRTTIITKNISERKKNF